MDLYTFMRKRGIRKDVISEFKKENMDCSVIRTMEESQLQNYLPKYGDRLAIIEFCKQNHSCLEEHQEQLHRKDNKRKCSSSASNSDEEGGDIKQPKVFIGKSTRTVELAWLCSLNGHRYVKVNSSQGGGTRRVTISRAARLQELIEKARNLFFPNNVSTKGHITKFSVQLFDFQQKKVEANTILDEFIELTGVFKPRFYLATKEVVATASSSNNYKSENETVVDYKIGCRCSSNSDVSAAASPDSNRSLPNASLLLLSKYLKNEEFKLTLHQGQVFDEMINVFLILSKDDPLPHIEIKLQNEQMETQYDNTDNGVDFKDVLNEFWNTFYEKCTLGTFLKVPYIRHDFNADKWAAVAKILFRGYKDQKYFPRKLAPSFMEHCMFGKTLTNLGYSFSEYLDSEPAEILQTALNKFTVVDSDNLLDTLQFLECKRKPTEKNIAEIIHDLAHKELIQKPMFVINCWSNILEDMVDESEFEDLYRIELSKNEFAHGSDLKKS